MELFEKLTEEECEIIHEYIEEYASNKGERVEVIEPLKHILRFWNTDKQDMYKLLGAENLIISKEIEFIPEADEMAETLVAMRQRSPFVREWRDWTYSLRYSDKPMTRGYILPTYELSIALDTLIGDDESLLSNRYKGESFEIPCDLPNCSVSSPIKVEHGCKVSKIIGKIAKAFGIEGFVDYQNEVSRIIQSNKGIRGTLNLSIHPLDYMTMSDNDCGWDTCMSWAQPGDYRQGTVEMMNSPCVVVAYIAAQESFRATSNYYWNSKKWRTLFIVNENIIINTRQYPYCNTGLAHEAATWLKELAEKNLGYKYSDNYQTMINELVSDKNESVTFRAYCNAMYNDFGKRSEPRGIYLGQDIPYSLLAVEYSGESECMCCGCEINSEDPRLLLCDGCESLNYCCCCGDYIEGTTYYDAEENQYCEWCYCENTLVDIATEGTYHTDRVDLYHLSLNDEVASDGFPVFDPESPAAMKFFGCVPNRYGWYDLSKVKDPKEIRRLLECYGYYLYEEAEKYIDSLSD